MKEYKELKELVSDICQLKEYVVKLDYTGKVEFQKEFYSLPFREWKLNILWDYIWDYKTYNEIIHILEKDLNRENKNRL